MEEGFATCSLLLLLLLLLLGTFSCAGCALGGVRDWPLPSYNRPSQPRTTPRFILDSLLPPTHNLHFLLQWELVPSSNLPQKPQMTTGEVGPLAKTSLSPHLPTGG